MGGFYGADVAALRELAQSIADAAQRLDTLSGQVDAAVRTVPWTGPNGEAFLHAWSGVHKPAMARVGGTLADAAEAVRRNAADQESTSTDDGHGPGAGGSDGSGPRGSGRPGDGTDRPGDPGLTKNLGDYEPVGEIPLTNDAFDPRTISQGQVGDCWLLAALGAIARNDPDFLREHMVLNDDGTWTVTMYNDGKPVEITVEPTVPENGAGAPGGEPNWVSIYEKAAAEYFGGDYEDLDGGFSSTAFEAITGQEADRSGELDLAEIQKRLANGPVAVGTEGDGTWWPFDDEIDDNRIVPNHAYTVDKVEEVDGKLMIHVLNPWGPDGGNYDNEHRVGDIWLSEEEYKENFDSVYSVPSTKE